MKSFASSELNHRFLLTTTSCSQDWFYSFFSSVYRAVHPS